MRLPDKLDSNARVEVRVNGVVVGTRRIIDIVADASGEDDGVNDVVTITLASGGGGGDAGTNFWRLVSDTLLTNDQSQTPDLNRVIIDGNADGDAQVDIDTGNGNRRVYLTAGAPTGTGNSEVGLTSQGTVFLSTQDGTSFIIVGPGESLSFQPPIDLSLTDTGVVPGSYGGAEAIPVFEVDAKGRVTSADSVSTGSGLWQLIAKVLSPASAPDTFTVTTKDDINLTSADRTTITGDEVFLFGVSGSGNSLSLYDDGRVNLYSEGQPLELVAHLSDLNISAGGNVVFTDPLPTSDPGVSGALWNDTGTLKISP